MSTEARGRLEAIADILEQYAEEVQAGGEAGFGGDDAERYEWVFDHLTWLRRELRAAPPEFNL